MQLFEALIQIRQFSAAAMSSNIYPTYIMLNSCIMPSCKGCTGVLDVGAGRLPLVEPDMTGY